MAWIKVIPENLADGKLKEVYEEISKKRGKLSNILKIQSLHPESLKYHMDLYVAIMFGKSGISREDSELIAVIVSVANRCAYCINHHAQALNHYWKDQSKIDQLVLGNYKNLDLPVKTFAVLKYAEKLTVAPQLIEETDIDNLKLHGLDDKEILNINLIVSYFNFVNRVANGLGVETDEDEMMGYKY